MGLAIGVAIVVGLIALAVAAGGVLVLAFIAILLASALEPIDRRHPGPPAARARRDDPGRLRDLLRDGHRPRLHRRPGRDRAGSGDRHGPAVDARLDPLVGGDSRTGDPRRHRSRSSRTRQARSSRRRPAPNPDQVVEVGAAAAEAAIAVATLLTLVFFWLLEHARLQRYVLAYFPADNRAGARDIWNEVETRLGLWVRGQLTLMGTMGVATGTAYFLLGVPGALLLGLIAAITEAIPIVGPLLGAIPAVLVASTVSPELALIVAGVYIVIQLIEGSVLVPLVMRNTIGISPLLVMLSLLVGAAVGGLLGALLAVPIVASAEIILSQLQAREKPVAQDPAAIETPDDETRGDHQRSLPDAGDGLGVVPG